MWTIVRAQSMLICSGNQSGPRCSETSVRPQLPKGINDQRPERLIAAITKFVQADLHRRVAVAGLVAVTAEYSVPQRQVKTEIAVGFFLVHRVMDTVHLGRYQ